MTEAGPVLAMCLAFAKEPCEVKSGSCGTVVRNAALKIVDPDTGASLGRNQPGEICIRGEQIMKGTAESSLLQLYSILLLKSDLLVLHAVSSCGVTVLHDGKQVVLIRSLADCV